MKYTVDWNEHAEADLAAIWMMAPDPEAIRLASNVIEFQLGSDPLHYGQPLRSSVYRVGYHAPLGVEFEVIEDDKRVLVQSVWFSP